MCLAFFICILPLAAVAGDAKPGPNANAGPRNTANTAGKSYYNKQRNLNAALFMAMLPPAATTDNAGINYDKLRDIIGSCTKAWQSKYAWDYIIRCPARPELIELSKKNPDARFVSIPKTNKEFAKLARLDKILVNVNPFGARARDGEITKCYRIMADGTDVANLPDGPYAVNVCLPPR